MAIPVFLSGWRPSLPDIRDKVYKAPFFKAYPPSSDLFASVGPPVTDATDQGNLGSCGPNTLSENLAFDEEITGASGVWSSRLFLYYNTRVLMGTINSDSGVENRSMLKALAKYGFCDESLWPYDIYRFTQKPPQAAFEAAAKNIPNILYQSVPQDLQSMKSVLCDLKRPIIFGFTVYNSMFMPNVTQTGDVPMPGGLFDAVAGGHDVLIYGYDDATQRFKFKNHWTAGWGNNGNGTIPYAYATNPNLAGDFWVVTKDTGGSPMPDPTPTPTPPGPSTIQQWIDQIFTDLKTQFANRPFLLEIITMVQQYVDSMFASQALTAAPVTGPVKDAIDALFAGVEASLAGRPLMLWAVKIVQGLADTWLAAHGL